MHEIHARFGKLLSGTHSKKAKSNSKTPGLADTGEETCTAENSLLALLGIDISFLLLTGMSVSGISSNGRYTRQLVYIANEARSLIFAEKALKDQGVIPENFPCAEMFGPDPKQLSHGVQPALLGAYGAVARLKVLSAAIPA